MEKEEITLAHFFAAMKDGFASANKRFDRMEASLDKKLDTKINGLEMRVDGKISSLESRLELKFNDFESSIKGQIDSLESSLSYEIEKMKNKLCELIKDASGGIDNLAFYSATKKEHRALRLRVHKLESKSAGN